MIKTSSRTTHVEEDRRVQACQTVEEACRLDPRMQKAEAETVAQDLDAGLASGSDPTGLRQRTNS